MKQKVFILVLPYTVAKHGYPASID